MLLENVSNRLANLDGKKYRIGDLAEKLEDNFELTEEERRELLPSGRQTVFRNRVGWAKTYLKKAKLIASPERGSVVLTERGKGLLAENPEALSSKSLERYEEFLEFKVASSRRTEDETASEEESSSDLTPEEALDDAYQKLKQETAEELLGVISECSPAFFEKLVIDLLIEMGYGGSRKEAGQAVGRSGDGGIDGIIKEDKLGLDIIYIQAKRWQNTVPVKEVRDFAGALLAQKAKKGIFLTTSDYSSGAYEYVGKVEHKIILINGRELANLMIENNVGVSTINRYEVKRVDSDYFEDV